MCINGPFSAKGYFADVYVNENLANLIYFQAT